MSIEATQRTESDLLGCCLLDGATIDRALQQGITPGHFSHVHHRQLWSMLCDLRLTGRDTTAEGVFAAWSHDPSKLNAAGGMGGIVSHQSATTAHASSLIVSIIEIHGKREGWRVLSKGLEGLKSGSASLEDLAGLADELKEVATCQRSVQRSTADIAKDAIRQAEEQIAGQTASRTLIYTGLPMFDKYATPIEPHEIVVVGARTSHGKTAFMSQVAGHNLARKLNVAYFPLETSDTPTLSQIVGQRAGVNTKKLNEEMPNKQQEYLERLRYARDSKNLMIFDNDTSLSQIEARCRLLATSFKPDLVIIDYLGLIQTGDRETYQRLTNISKALIPLRKGLGCAVMIGAQFSRELEKEKREPMRTDFRDSGSIEEDSSRIIAVYREPDQPLDNEWFYGSVMQLKMRDGPLAKVPVRFHGPTRRFFEQVTNN